MTRTFAIAGTALGLALAAPATAQTASASPSGAMGALGGAGGGLLGSMLPNLGGAGVGNVAGLLSYCVKNQLVGGTTANSALGKLLGRSDVTSTDAFAAGQSGQLATTQGNAFSLDAMKGKLKTRMCSMVLQRAKSFL